MNYVNICSFINVIYPTQVTAADLKCEVLYQQISLRF
jgi:hypothetical protein